MKAPTTKEIIRIHEKVNKEIEELRKKMKLKFQYLGHEAHYIRTRKKW